MNARRGRAVVAVVSMFAVLTANVASIALASAASPSPSPGPMLAELRMVEIDGARIVSLSPDGRWIAAARPATRPHEALCVYAVDTLEERSCSDTGTRSAGVRPEEVAWSPDGTRLVFSEEIARTYSDGDLWLMDAATGELRNLDDDGFTGGVLTRGEATPDTTVTLPRSPAFSSDGQRVAFSRSLLVDGVPAGNDIAVVPVEGGAPERLARVAEDGDVLVASGVGWAPDDGTLYYSVRGTSGRTGDGLWAVDTSTGATRLVARAMSEDGGPLTLVSVSPAGDLLLAMDPERYARTYSGPVLALVDPRTGSAEPLLPPVGDPAHAIVLPAAFSPDGSSLLLVSRMVDPDFQLHVLDLDSGRVGPLVPSGLPIVPALDAPTWSAAGTILIRAGAGEREGSDDVEALGRAVLLVPAAG